MSELRTIEYSVASSTYEKLVWLFSNVYRHTRTHFSAGSFHTPGWQPSSSCWRIAGKGPFLVPDFCLRLRQLAPWGKSNRVVPG